MSAAARDALKAWTARIADEKQRAELSKLIAAYVAECVRADRETRTPTDEELAKRARDAVAKVNAINGTASGLHSLFAATFGGARK